MAQLASMIRSKYPGEYDDLSDEELEAKIVAKYPGEYDDLVTPKVESINSIPNELPEKLPTLTLKDYIQNTSDKFNPSDAKKSYRPAGLGRVDEQVFDTAPIHELAERKKTTVERYLANKTGSYWPTAIGSAINNTMLAIPELLADVVADPTSLATTKGIVGGTRGSLESVANDIVKPMIPRTVGSSVNTRPIRALLPKVTETKPTTFISGEGGTVRNQLQPYDSGPFNRLPEEPVTVMPSELGEINMVSPELPASGMIPAKPTSGVSIGNRIDRLLPGEISEPTGFTQPQVFTGLGHARLGEAQLPSAIIKQRIKQQTVNELIESGTDPIKAESVVSIAEQTPELMSVVTNPNFVKKFLTSFNKRETPTSRFTAKIGSSIDSELNNQLPRLGEIVKQTQADSHIKAGTWINQYDNIVEKLTDNEFSSFVKAIEGKEVSELPKVTEAIVHYKELDTRIAEEMTSTGAGLRSQDGTKVIPWQARDNYWPHLYTKDTLELLKRNPEQLREKLMESGMSPLEIDAMLTNSRQFGERLIDAQHAREANLPGYRTDKNVYRQHITEMAKRIVEAKNYGPLDLADVDSPLMSLIKESKNPEYSTEMMKKLLNRGQLGDFDSMDISRKLTGIQAWLHLSTAGISNLNSLAMIPIQTTTKNFVRGLTETIMNSRTTGEFAKESGALQNIFKEIFAAAIDETDKLMPTKVYGLDAGEKFMRTVSSSAGRSYSKQLFNEMKSGNTNPSNLQKLQDLTLTNPDDLMKQTALNEQQLKRAAFRTAELSQGLAESQNLPFYWTGSGLSNILTLFHKYQFAQTKIVKDLIKQNPVRAVPMLLGASQIAGEVTGDSKAFIRGLIRTGVSGDETSIEDEILNRGEFIESKFGLEESPLAARFIENMGQSFALGIYADVIEAFAGGGSDVLKQLAGSTLNDLMKVIDMGRDTIKGDYWKAATKGTSLIPLVGPPIAKEMREPY